MSSSERKGILIVGGIALLVTLAGLGVAWCGRPRQTVTPADVEILVAGDTVNKIDEGERGVKDSLRVDSTSADTVRKRRARKHYDDESPESARKVRRSGTKEKDTPRTKPATYGRRSPRDEIVPLR